MKGDGLLFRLQIGSFNSKLSALVAFCYLCVSVLLPLQHTDHLAAPIMATVEGAATHSCAGHTPRQMARQPSAGLQRQDHCLACEWQAVQVSAALPAFTLVLTPPQPIRVVTTLPRYLRLLTFPASSRAPPLA